MSTFLQRRGAYKAVQALAAAEQKATNMQVQMNIWKHGAEVLQAELAALRAYMSEHAPMELRAFDVGER